MIHVHEIDATCVFALLYECREQVHCFDLFLAQTIVAFCGFVQFTETIHIAEKCFIHLRNIVWAKQGDVSAGQQSFIHDFVELHSIVHVTHTVFVGAFVVFQYQQIFYFQMPQGIIQCGCSAAHTTLAATFDCCLEMFVKRYHTCVIGIAITDRTVECADATGANADTSTLAHILDDTAGCGIDRVQTVVGFNQHATTELFHRCAHTCHDRSRQTDLVLADGIIVIAHPVESCILWILCKQRGRDQHIAHLRCFKNITGHTILYQVFATQLFHSHIRETFVALVVYITVEPIPLVGSIIIGQFGIIKSALDIFLD